MESENWVIRGMSRGKFFDRPGGCYGIIELHDLGSDDYVGAFYVSDKSRQMQPLVWHGNEARRRLHAFREDLNRRPRLRVKQQGRPHLRAQEPKHRPHLKASEPSRPHLRSSQPPAQTLGRSRLGLRRVR